MPHVPGLEPDEERLVGDLMAQWRRKLPRNELRSTYYSMKNVLKDLEISIPPHMKDVETVFGWAAKSVDMLAARTRLDGFVLPNGAESSFGLDEMYRENRLRIEAPQSHRSAFIHSVSFVMSSLGDTAAGEPKVLVTARSARTATGIWSRRLRRLTSALAITDSDAYGASEMTLYLPDRIVTMRRTALGKWDIRRDKHSLGRCPVEPLVYRPDLDRPFGQSRISRASMSIIDSAVRTALRTEVSAEFFAAPQRYALGVDASAFAGEDGATRSGWESIIGRLLAIGRDEDGNVPTVGTFAQQSMEPHLAQLRQLATRFAGESNIPVYSLGVVHDANPSGSEAMEVAERDLITDAEDAQDVFGFAWAQTARNSVQMREKLSEAPAELDEIEIAWRPAKTPSRAAAADATTKLVASFPYLAESEVILEHAGLDRATVARIAAERRKASMSKLAANMPGAVSAATATMTPDVRTPIRPGEPSTPAPDNPSPVGA